jgi:crotonobetainyl-CoA:carnitine CoA-transferase CaiB-like acyl-CoA transferase
MWLRFGFMDHLCALSSVLSTLLACYSKATTGIVTEVRGSLLGAGAMTYSETFVRADGTTAPCPVLDGQQVAVSLGRRIAATADGWIAIAADSDAEVATLLRVTGAADHASLVAALATRASTDWLLALSDVRIACGPLKLAQKAAFFDDVANRACGLVASYPHAEWGTLEQPGALWYFGDLPLRHELAPPTLGQHTVEILEALGVEAEAIDALLDTGAAVAYRPS